MVLSCKNRELYQLTYRIPQSILNDTPEASNNLILGRSKEDWVDRLKFNANAQIQAIAEYDRLVISKTLPTGSSFNDVTEFRLDRNQWKRAIQLAYNNPYIIDDYWKHRGNLFVLKGGFDDRSTTQFLPTIQSSLTRLWYQATPLRLFDNTVITTYSEFLMFILVTLEKKVFCYGINTVAYVANEGLARFFSFDNNFTWMVKGTDLVDTTDNALQVQFLFDMNKNTPDVLPTTDLDYLLLGKHLGTSFTSNTGNLPNFLYSYEVFEQNPVSLDHRF